MKKRKRLLKSEKELLLQWIAEGLLTDEINKRAARCAAPFKVSRQQVEYYRRSRNQDVREILEQTEFKAMNTGLAIKSERVQVLKDLAVKMAGELNDGKLWLTRIKSVGGGPNFHEFTEEEFNKSEMDALRGVLDDIAKELGHRAIKSEVISDSDGEFRVIFHNPYAQESEDE